jgi:UDP-2,3-diacylglucosamine pyrophosphatase LpxH
MLTKFGKERISFSKKIKNSVKEAIKFISDFEQTTTDLAISNGYDYVICGHIHQPQKRVISNKEGSVVYLNSGDWVEHLTSLEYYNKDWHIYEYDPAIMKTLTIKELTPQPDVMTNDIAFYLHSLSL